MVRVLRAVRAVTHSQHVRSNRYHALLKICEAYEGAGDEKSKNKVRRTAI